MKRVAAIPLPWAALYLTLLLCEFIGPQIYINNFAVWCVGLYMADALNAYGGFNIIVLQYQDISLGFAC